MQKYCNLKCDKTSNIQKYFPRNENVNKRNINVVEMNKKDLMSFDKLDFI